MMVGVSKLRDCKHPEKIMTGLRCQKSMAPLVLVLCWLHQGSFAKNIAHVARLPVSHYTRFRA